jgi:hypothetical protein
MTNARGAVHVFRGIIAMPTNTAAIRVGRLLEIRADAGYRTPSDVDELFELVGAEAAKRPSASQCVVVVDWRCCPVMSPAAAERMTERIVLNNSRTERSAALASKTAPVAVLQFVRLIRTTHLVDRKLFYVADELVRWLGEILTPFETHRLRDFLGESTGVP